MALRTTILVLLAAAPLALGSVHAPAYIPLLVIASGVGLVSWARGHWARAHGIPVTAVPGWRSLLAVHALVLFQLVPLPPRLLALVSPGSFSHYDFVSLVPLREWRPISVSPADTARGLLFLAAMSLLYAAVFREFGRTRWRRRLALTVIGTGLAMTILALVQAASGTKLIYGLWRPTWDWNVFGPYVNRNHFAGYLVMAIPLGMGLILESLRGLRQAWGRRRWGFMALLDPNAPAAVRRAAVTAALMTGLIASGSRGGVVAAGAAMLALVLLLRSWAWSLAVILIAGAGVGFVDFESIERGFATRGLQASRLDLWSDALRMFGDFPLLGAGFNAFGTAFLRYQTLWPGTWFGEAHNEYLQALLDMGLVGAAIAGVLLVTLFRGALAAARRGPLDAGLFASLVGAAVHATVDFNWQIPANAATFVALAGLTLRRAANASAEESLPGAALDPHRGRA